MMLFSVVFQHGKNVVHDKYMFYMGGSATIVEGQDFKKWSFSRQLAELKIGVMMDLDFGEI